MEWIPESQHFEPSSEEILQMSEQENSRSAFIESMEQITGFTEWVDILDFLSEEEKKDEHPNELTKAVIDRCNQNIKEIVTFQSGTRIQTNCRMIYIFTLHINSYSENDYSDYSEELQSALAAIAKTESELTSISATKKETKGDCNIYYLRLVFPVTE